MGRKIKRARNSKQAVAVKRRNEEIPSSIIETSSNQDVNQLLTIFPEEVFKSDFNYI